MLDDICIQLNCAMINPVFLFCLESQVLGGLSAIKKFLFRPDPLIRFTSLILLIKSLWLLFLPHENNHIKWKSDPLIVTITFLVWRFRNSYNNDNMGPKSNSIVIFVLKNVFQRIGTKIGWKTPRTLKAGRFRFDALTPLSKSSPQHSRTPKRRDRSGSSTDPERCEGMDRVHLPSRTSSREPTVLRYVIETANRSFRFRSLQPLKWLHQLRTST